MPEIEQYTYRGCMITIQRGSSGMYEAGILMKDTGLLFDVRARGKKACREAANAKAAWIDAHKEEIKAKVAESNARRLAALMEYLPAGELERLRTKFGLSDDPRLIESLCSVWRECKERLAACALTYADQVPVGAVREAAEIAIAATPLKEGTPYGWSQTDILNACRQVVLGTLQRAFPDACA